MKRIFLATDIIPDPAFLNDLGHIRHKLEDEHVKWVDFARLHLTLKFFGETEEKQIESISEALTSTLASQEGFQLRLASLGVFRSLSHPQVIWVGCDKPEGLTGLKNAIDWALESLGIPPEKRDFSPHFTLGRIKHMRSTAKLGQLMEHYRGHTFCVQGVDRLILYESILKPQGPEYIPLRTWKLSAHESSANRPAMI